MTATDPIAVKSQCLTSGRNAFLFHFLWALGCAAENPLKYLATHLNSTQKAIFYCKEAHASSSLFAPENCNSATDNRKEQLLQLSVQGELGVKGPCIALLLSYLLSLPCPSSPLSQTDLSPCLDQSHLTSISSAAHPFPLSFPPAFWDAFVFCLLRYLLELRFPRLSV